MRLLPSFSTIHKRPASHFRRASKDGSHASEEEKCDTAKFAHHVRIDKTGVETIDDYFPRLLGCAGERSEFADCVNLEKFGDVVSVMHMLH